MTKARAPRTFHTSVDDNQLSTTSSDGPRIQTSYLVVYSSSTVAVAVLDRSIDRVTAAIAEERRRATAIYLFRAHCHVIGCQQEYQIVDKLIAARRPAVTSQFVTLDLSARSATLSSFHIQPRHPPSYLSSFNKYTKQIITRRLSWVSNSYSPSWRRSSSSSWPCSSGRRSPRPSTGRSLGERHERTMGADL